MGKTWCILLLLCLALPVLAVSQDADRDLLIRIDERVVALRTDVLAMQVRLLGIETAITEIRIDAAKAGATYGALSGAFAAAMSIIVSSAVRSWLESRKKASLRGS